MSNFRTSKNKKIIKRMIALVITVCVAFAFRSKLSGAVDVLNGSMQEVNFKLVDIKSVIYNQKLKLKTKINDVLYLNEYIEKNKNKDFELQKSKLYNVELENLKEENQRLRMLLEMRNKSASEYIAADVALVEKLDADDRIFINKGKNQGVIKNLPVIYNGYLIGKITKVGDEFAEVMLLTNKNSKISIVIDGTNMQILRGNGNGTFSIFNYNENISEKTNFNLETSGMSDVFPRGLKIGTFEIKEVNAFKQMREVRLKPSYSVFDIQSVLVYKWNGSNSIQNEIQNQIELEIQQEFQKNKNTTQTN